MLFALKVDGAKHDQNQRVLFLQEVLGVQVVLGCGDHLFLNALLLPQIILCYFAETIQTQIVDSFSEIKIEIVLPQKVGHSADQSLSEGEAYPFIELEDVAERL